MENFHHITNEYQLDELCRISPKKYDPNKDTINYKCIELEHIEQNIGTINGFTWSKNQQSTKNKFNANHVLFGKLRPYLKKFYNPSFEGVCSSEIWVLEPTSIIKKDYLFYLIQSNKFITAANISCGSKMPRADWDYMKEISFSIPDFTSQTKIATFLNLYYKKIELQRNKVKKFINFKHHVVKSVINNKGDKYQLCELCQINKGQQLNKLNMLEYGQYKVYNGGISYSGYTNKFNTNENTISISEGGNSCGFVNFINEKFWSGGHNYTLSNLKINTKYLYFILKSCQEDIMKLRVGSGLPNIQKSALEKFQVFIKKNNLSRNLCLFELLEKKNVLEQQKLELLEKYKQGLLQKMFI